MQSGFLEQLLDLLGSPLGLLGLTLGGFLIYQARRSLQFAWFLVAVCCFAASLNEFRDQFVPDAPNLVFPLEQIRAAGRPLTIFLMGLLLGLGTALPSKVGWRCRLMPPAIWALVVIQVLILLKTLASGDILFSLLAIATFSGVVLMVRLGPSQWLQDDQQFYWGTWSLGVVGLIFVGANGYQAVVDPYPITFVHGALSGTTGNPQHAATLLATTIPCYLFLIQTQAKRFWKLFWAMALVLVLIALFLTASRTGAIMGGLSIVLFFRRGKNQFFQVAFILGLVLAVGFPFLGQTSGAVNTTAVTNNLLSLDNTRAEVWSAMWRAFNAYPLFGAPLQGDRLGYGENSWLAVAANLGVIGLLPLGVFGFSCIHMIIKLDRVATRLPAYAFHSNTVIAGLLSLLVGSIFEAFLLGTLTFPLIAILLYLALGQYLLEIYQLARQSHLKQRSNQLPMPNPHP